MPRPIHLVVPGPLDTPTGGFVYDRRVADGLRASGRLGGVTELPGDYPEPSCADLAIAAARIAEVPGDHVVVIDGLGLTALAGRLRALDGESPIVALVHHPLADETGVPPDRVEPLRRAEADALTLARGAVVTSRTTARRLADFGVPEDRVRVVVPGVDPVGAPRRRAGLPRALLTVASLTRRKGHDVLLGAVAACADLDWRLECVGPARDAAWALHVADMAVSLGLRERVDFHGSLDAAALEARYQAADLFLLASRHEGYGMVLSEALSHGLPVLSTTAGAIPEVVPSDAGLLVPPDDAAGLSAALRRLMTEPGLAEGLSAGALAVRFPDWHATAREFAVAVDSLTALERSA